MNEIEQNIDFLNKKEISSPPIDAKRAIEALLFASAEPLNIKKIQDLLRKNCPLPLSRIRKEIEELREEYDKERRSFQLQWIPEGALLSVRPEWNALLDSIHGRKKERLSSAAHEVLAIIAYQQPVTRVDIDAIRGVDSTGPLNQLVNKELITPCGKRDAPGRPTLYKTTDLFLLRFGMTDLSELPTITTLQEECDHPPTRKDIRDKSNQHRDNDEKENALSQEKSAFLALK